MRSDPVTSALNGIAVSDPPRWASRIARIALEPGAGTSLRASKAGWADQPPPPAAAGTLRSHPDAEPDDPVRSFRCDTIGASVTVIARDGVIGAHVAHDGGAELVCDDLAKDEWRQLR